MNEIIYRYFENNMDVIAKTLANHKERGIKQEAAINKVAKVVQSQIKTTNKILICIILGTIALYIFDKRLTKLEKKIDVVSAAKVENEDPAVEDETTDIFEDDLDEDGGKEN